MTNINCIKENSIHIYNGLVTIFSQFNTEEALDPSDIASKFNGCFATNNSTICFVSDNEVYVTPHTRLIESLLNAEGFKKKMFYVPFSNGDYPKLERPQWETLQAKAQCSRENEFVEACACYCDDHGIGGIRSDTLKNCFEIPKDGIKVVHHYFDDYYYPFLNSRFFDCIAGSFIGRFSRNNGIVAFVYRDGKTYVTKGYKIIAELEEAGYKESSFFVPFSNREKIQDPALSARWDAITK